MIIAITGCIGSGKSYIANLIHKKYGYDIFDSDVIAKSSYDDETVKQKLDEVFNCVINGKVDKSIIKQKLNKDNIKQLNNIIHPFVKEKILQIKMKYQNSLAFVEVPLLFESNMEDIFDGSLVISVDDKLRHQRLKNRSEKDYLDMLKLESHQLSNDEKVKRATYVLKSSENKDLNLKQLNDIIYVINKK